MDEIVQNTIVCSDRPPPRSQKNQGLFVERELRLGKIGLFLSHIVHELVERIVEYWFDIFLHLALVSVYNFMG